MMAKINKAIFQKQKEPIKMRSQQIDLKDSVGLKIISVTTHYNALVIVFEGDKFVFFKEYQDFELTRQSDYIVSIEMFSKSIVVREDDTICIINDDFDILEEAGIMTIEEVVSASVYQIEKIKKERDERDLKAYNKLKDKFETKPLQSKEL